MVSPTVTAAMRQRGRQRTNGGDDDRVDPSEVRWLISYSDYMMQLVCLFILLFSVSSVSAQKLRAVAEEARKYLHIPARGKYEAVGPRPPVVIPVSLPVLARVLEELREDQDQLHYGGEREVHRVDAVPLHEGIKITVQDASFEEGSAEIPTAMDDPIEKVVKSLIANSVTRVEVRGHTSESPADRANGDEWLLSYQRARAVADRILGNRADPRVKPARLRITGCAYNEPARRGSPAQPSGDPADRRVEIVITEEHVDAR